MVELMLRAWRRNGKGDDDVTSDKRREEKSVYTTQCMQTSATFGNEIVINEDKIPH